MNTTAPAVRCSSDRHLCPGSAACIAASSATIRSSHGWPSACCCSRELGWGPSCGCGLPEGCAEHRTWQAASGHGCLRCLADTRCRTVTTGRRGQKYLQLLARPLQSGWSCSCMQGCLQASPVRGCMVSAVLQPAFRPLKAGAGARSKLVKLLWHPTPATLMQTSKLSRCYPGRASASCVLRIDLYCTAMEAIRKLGLEAPTLV